MYNYMLQIQKELKSGPVPRHHSAKAGRRSQQLAKRNDYDMMTSMPKHIVKWLNNYDVVMTAA